MPEPTNDQPEGASAPPGLGNLLGFQMSKCAWWLEQRLETGLEPLGIRVRHFLVLTMLEASDTLSQQDLATYLALDPTLMVALIDDLESGALCERIRNPDDRRRYTVRITAGGRDLLTRGRGIADAVGEEVFGELSGDERRRLVKVIGRVMEPYWVEQRARPRRRPVS